VIVSAISPYRSARDEVRFRIPNFVEVYMECPLDVLIARDVKGLYKRALAGEIAHFTGVSDPYEPPLAPEVTIRSDRETAEAGVEKVWQALAACGVLARSASL
jgi:adenylylsulfate kinase-like enzyme